MLRLTEGVLAGAMPARPRTKVEARSRTNSLSLSSSSPLTAPAMARRRAVCWRKYSAMWGVPRARDRLSRASPTFSAVSQIFLHSPYTMRSTARAHLGGDALGRQRHGRRRGIERRKGAFSWRVFHERHHLRMTGGGNAPQTSRFWRLTKSQVSQFDSEPPERRSVELRPVSVKSL
jgi:hypothetical protein